MDFSDYKPRLPGNGIRAETQRGKFGKSWWASRWIAALERVVGESRLSRGRSYARTGQVVRLDVKQSRIDAGVQGSRPTPYKVSITLRPLPDDAWERVVEAMAGEAIHAARLLSGEMPESIEDVFERAGSSLFPRASGDLTSTCSCPDSSNPCKHVAAVHYLLGERFDTDPFLMFELRGRTKDQVLEALRAHRTGDVEPTADDPPAPGKEPEPTGSTSISLADFWSSPTEIRLPLTFDAPRVDALPVKLLGKPPFWQGPDDFNIIMEALYHAISTEATRLALSPDQKPAD